MESTEARMKKTKTDADRANQLFHQRRYGEAIATGSEAKRNDSTMSTMLRGRIDDLIRASRLVQKVEKQAGDDGVTAKLQSGWYSKRIRALVREDRLEKIASVPVPMEPVPDQNYAATEDDLVITDFENETSGCAVAMCIGGKGKGLHEDVGTGEAGKGASRTIPFESMRGDFLDQMTNGRIFTKDGVATYLCKYTNMHQDGYSTCSACQGYPLPMYKFPLWDVATSSSVVAAESPLLDVQYGVDLVSDATKATLHTELKALGEQRRDSPAPKYHNIIDPNIGAVNDTWVPTEFSVFESPWIETVAVLERACEKATNGSSLPQGFLEKAFNIHSPSFLVARAEMRSPIPDLDPHDNVNLYVAVQDVMEAALPLLARLKLPALLLPGPLQAVVKAQRIVLKDGETYQGVWHQDGRRESVVAVVLYYYGVSPTLNGGQMEIVSKLQSALGAGEAGLHQYYDDSQGLEGIAEIPRRKVPVKEGTLLVFGNYSALHRVLSMKADGGPGSRDFLAFFVIDQRAPLPMHRDLGPLAVRKQRRGYLLKEQLQRRGKFGVDGTNVYTTGNGDYIDIAWLSAGYEFPFEGWNDDYHAGVAEVCAVVSQMNITPPIVGRGLSFLQQYGDARVKYDEDSKWVTHIVGSGNQQERFFVNTETSQYQTEPPNEETISSILAFESVEEWNAFGLTLAPSVPRQGNDDDDEIVDVDALYPSD